MVEDNTCSAKVFFWGKTYFYLNFIYSGLELRIQNIGKSCSATAKSSQREIVDRFQYDNRPG